MKGGLGLFESLGNIGLILLERFLPECRIKAIEIRLTWRNMPGRNDPRTDVSTVGMVISISTITLEKEISLKPKKFWPGIPLDHDIAVKIQGPVKRLRAEPPQQIHLYPIPHLEFIGSKRRHTYLPPVLDCRILIENTGNVLPPKEGIRILVATDDTEDPWNQRNLLEPLAQIHRIVLVSASRHRPDDSALMYKGLNIHLLDPYSFYIQIQRRVNSMYR